jgi:hypothetical protein
VAETKANRRETVWKPDLLSLLVFGPMFLLLGLAVALLVITLSRGPADGKPPAAAHPSAAAAAPAQE